MSRTIKMMPVAHILQNVRRSLDVDMYDEFDWFKVLANKVSHAHFDELTDTILAEGFTLPIVLVGNDDDGYCVGNGHHRLCVAILTGLTAIPVIVNDENDYWAFEDSHDGEWNPGERSFEYWGMLEENIPDGYYGDVYNEVHRAQFANRPDAACDSCGYEECECCGECDTYPCVCNQCPECEYDDDDCRCEIVTPNGVNEYAYHYIRCLHCEGWGYRIDHMECGMNDAWSEAITENAAHIPTGMWHPAYILDDAYAQHAEWLKDEPIRIARQEWETAVQQMRNVCADGCSDVLISIVSGKVRAKWEAWQAVQGL